MFETQRGLRVHHSRQHDEHLPNRTCRNCNHEFYCRYEKRYCSDNCREESVSFSGSANPNYQGGKETTNCELCGRQFTYYPSEKEGLYCSMCVESETWQTTPTVRGDQHPRWKGGKVERPCTVCDEPVERYPSNISDVVVCSESCRRTWLSDEFTGEGHPNWKGGGNGPYGKGWNAVRKQALERDGYSCVVCSKSKSDIGRNPDVHHIIPVRFFIQSPDYSREDAHILENVISLCINCHRKADFDHISKVALWSRISGTHEKKMSE